ncbi:MAG TPA: glycosyltransferase [Gemmataceae bacterium]|nr:glycosyltransferase [Gemmataceae bacterium]
MGVIDPPLVSVIVCTRNRPKLLRRALHSVGCQDFGNFEVIVVDDGSDEPVTLPSGPRPRMRLIRIEHQGVGAARAAGLDAARGEFVAYCDDDDEWTPDHLSMLVSYLREHPEVDLVYADSEWVQGSGPPAVAYSINYDGMLLGQENYIFATDVLHRAEAARAAGGFDPALQAYEDWDLWLRLSRRHTLRHLPAVLGRHYWHEGCVAAAEHWQDWERVHQRHQRWLAEAGDAARHDLELDAARDAPFDPATWRPGRRELIWHSLLRPNEGYGTAGRQLLLALEAEGVKVVMAPTRNQPPPGLERFYRPLDHWGRLGFYYHYWNRPGVLRCERVVNYSMWESTGVPPEHVEAINRAVALQYVPCRQNAESFRACGVRVPIKVLHHGVDAGRFPYLDRPRRENFTLGTFGDLSPRKGIDVLLRAFRDEFSPREPVRLLLKGGSPTPAYRVDDPRVTLVSGYLNPDQLLELLRQMDVFVLPSRGEGFGLCGLEAMATGLPLIATAWGGPAEYLDPADSFPLSYRLVEAGGIESNHVRYFGLWAEPDYDHLRSLMRWLYEHPDEAAAKGRRAAERVRRQWTWARVARQMIADLDELAGG